MQQHQEREMTPLDEPTRRSPQSKGVYKGSRDQRPNLIEDIRNHRKKEMPALGQT